MRWRGLRRWDFVRPETDAGSILQQPMKFSVSYRSFEKLYHTFDLVSTDILLLIISLILANSCTLH